jgi:4-hydroxybenzoate polyprenyltransferase
VSYANFVKLPHTVFTLPFAVVGIVLASRRYPISISTVFLAVVALAAARFAAMGFNRIADRRLDALNPRTSARELPRRRLSVGEAGLLVTLMAAAFVGAAALLNRLCLVLAPFALICILAYSYSKRFTALSHLWLGSAMAIAPVGGYLAVTGEWSAPWWVLVLLATSVACWGGGFDVLYSLQDEEFDREYGLKSATVLFGAPGAIRASRALHAGAGGALVAFGLGAGLGPLFFAAVGGAALLLVWEHRLVRPYRYERLDAAFFAMNGIIAGLVMVGMLLDALLG